MFKSSFQIIMICFFSQFLIAQGSLVETYTVGDIPTSFMSYNATCNGPSTTISITLPTDFGDLEVLGIDIDYSMTSGNGGFMADQRSQIHFQNNNTSETVVHGTGDQNGTLEYNRTGVDIANGNYPGGTVLTFEMRAWRVWGDMEDCGVFYNKVDDNSWSITVHLDCPSGNVVFSSQLKLDEYASIFSSCDSIFGSLFIDGLGTPEPTDFSALTNLEYIGQHFTIADINGTSIINPSNIKYIGGNLVIDYYQEPSFNLAQDIMFVGGGISIQDVNFSSLSFLLNLNTSTLDFLKITYDQFAESHIDDLSPFTSVDSIFGDAILNVSGSSFSDLQSLQFIGGDFKVNGFNDINLLHLSNLDSIGGALIIEEIDNLSNLSGLENVAHISGNFELRSNSSLTDISSLNNMVSIGENLKLIGNAKLIDFNGFSNLSTIGGNIMINNNLLLDDLTGFANLAHIGGQILVESNSLLSDCCLFYSFYPNITSLPLFFSENAAGCYNNLDVYTSCLDQIDPDRDGIFSSFDNCPDQYNPNQEDADSDTIGNACDNCPLISNTNQLDNNNNFIGDACENPEPGKTGINTTSPGSGFEIKQSDLFLNDSSRSLIMKNVNGDCFRIYIDSEGNLQTKAISCPQ